MRRTVLLLVAVVLGAPLGGSRAEEAFASPPKASAAGRYAMQLRVATAARVMMVGRTRSVATSLLLVDLRREGGGWVQSHRVCDAKVDSGSPIAELTVPRAFVTALPPRAYRAVLGNGGSRYTADMGVEAIGFTPAQPDSPLPRDPTHPSVEDPDGDGEPGVTLRLRVAGLGSARLFVVQRSHLLLDGRQVTPDRIEGTVQVRLQEQHALGADPAFFRQNPVVRPDPERSGFTLVRIPSAMGCEELREQAATLFR